MAVFPWSELGLDGPADERAIRSAYAARVKIVRPDVDIAGFQLLVQARNLALRFTQHSAQRPLVRPAPTVPPATAQPPAESRSLPPIEAPTPEARTQAPILVDLGAFTKPGGDVPKTPKPAPTVALDTDQPKTPQKETEPDDRSAAAGPMARAELAPVADPDAVAKLLAAFGEAWRRDMTLPPIAPILKQLGEQSIVARQKLEPEALRTVAMLLDNGLFAKHGMAAARQKTVLSFIVALDDDYGWTRSDRRLYAMMPQAAADQLVRLLRVAREWHRTGVPPMPTRQVAQRSKVLGTQIAVVIGIAVAIFILRAFGSSNPNYSPTVRVPYTIQLPPTSPTYPTLPGYPAGPTLPINEICRSTPFMCGGPPTPGRPGPYQPPAPK